MRPITQNSSTYHYNDVNNLFNVMGVELVTSMQRRRQCGPGRGSWEPAPTEKLPSMGGCVDRPITCPLYAYPV